MYERVDITFYDAYSNTDEIPSIYITHDNFSVFFAVLDDSGLPYIDESIYYPVGFFFDGEYKDIEIERCNMDKVGSNYKKFFSDSNISNYYCINDVDFIFKPYKN